MATTDLYLKIFGNLRIDDLEIFKRHYNGETFADLSKSFNMSRQRCHQIYAKVENRIELFIAVMSAEIEEAAS